MGILYVRYFQFYLLMLMDAFNIDCKIAYNKLKNRKSRKIKYNEERVLCILFLYTANERTTRQTGTRKIQQHQQR